MRVCFFFNAQRHQLLHGISTAVELARRPGYEVHVASPSAGHVAYARELATRLGGAPIRFDVLDRRLPSIAQRGLGGSIPPKLLTLAAVARWLDGFDAVALPERTSLMLKRLGARHPAFIHLDHGAGDRAAGFDARIRQFDLVLMAGEKHRHRLHREGLIRPGAHAVTGYPKFDAADAARAPGWTPFPGDPRPVVLYAPHFSALGSWERLGGAVMEAFAGQDRYNLVVAPHVRLLDGRRQRARWAPRLARYADSPRIHLDPGSDACVDMSYTTLADVYIGDVSSQVYEFLRRPRPCLFLDANGTDWEGDENYAHWRYGPVLRTADGLIAAVDRACAEHGRFLPAQRAGFAETFATGAVSASAVAARAIGDWLDRRQRPAAAPRGLPLARAASLAGVLFGGWLLHDAVGPVTAPARANTFLEEAKEAWDATRARGRMRSQAESAVYDPVEIAAATGIRMPAVPAGWTITDVQIYPSDAGPSVQMSLRVPSGEAVTLFASRMNTPAGARPELAVDGDRHVAYWDRETVAFALFGLLPSGRVLALADDLAG